MASPRCHLLHARGKRIRAQPRDFNLLAARPTSTLRKAQAEVLSAPLSMAGDVPAGYSNFDLRAWRKPHVLWEFRHTTSEILRPLAADVVCDENLT